MQHVTATIIHSGTTLPAAQVLQDSFVPVAVINVTNQKMGIYSLKYLPSSFSATEAVPKPFPSFMPNETHWQAQRGKQQCTRPYRHHYQLTCSSSLVFPGVLNFVSFAGSGDTVASRIRDKMHHLNPLLSVCWALLDQLQLFLGREDKQQLLNKALSLSLCHKTTLAVFCSPFNLYSADRWHHQQAESMLVSKHKRWDSSKLFLALLNNKINCFYSTGFREGAASFQPETLLHTAQKVSLPATVQESESQCTAELRPARALVKFHIIHLLQ